MTDAMEKGKKLLVLGGKPIGSVDIVEQAKQIGIFTIVADYLAPEVSPAKQVADENWDVSIAEVDQLAQIAERECVNGVIAGVHEFCIRKGLELCQLLQLPMFCTLEQWDCCCNKKAFKEMCTANGIDVARTYKPEDENIDYPVIVKPADSDGSRGFSICHDRRELVAGIKNALQYSNDYLIEEYMQCDAALIHYTAVNGEIIFSGIADKYSRRLMGGSMVMGLQLFPSRDVQRYLNTVNDKAIKMFRSLGIQNGPIWVEAFNDGKRFVFNEMALRLGGSMTNHPVNYFTGIDQLKLTIDAAMGKPYEGVAAQYTEREEKYCILPIHVKKGTIARIYGIEELAEREHIKAIVPVHNVGDEIQDWGTAQQVCFYVHFTFKNGPDFQEKVKELKKILHVEDIQGKEQLFYLMETDELEFV